MKTNKLISSVWLFVLIVVSIPVGGYFALGIKKFHYEDYWFEFAIGGVAMIIVLGVLARIVFGYYRKAKDEKAAYRGLFVYSFFLVCFAVIALFLYPGVKEFEAQSLYLEKLESEVIHDFEVTIANVEPLNADLKSRIRSSAESVCDLIKMDKELLEKIMNDKIPYSKKLIEKYPEIKEIQNLTMEFSDSEVMVEMLTLE